MMTSSPTATAATLSSSFPSAGANTRTTPAIANTKGNDDEITLYEEASDDEFFEEVTIASASPNGRAVQGAGSAASIVEVESFEEITVYSSDDDGKLMQALISPKSNTTAFTAIGTKTNNVNSTKADDDTVETASPFFELTLPPLQPQVSGLSCPVDLEHRMDGFAPNENNKTSEEQERPLPNTIRSGARIPPPTRSRPHDLRLHVQRQLSGLSSAGLESVHEEEDDDESTAFVEMAEEVHAAWSQDHHVVTNKKSHFHHRTPRTGSKRLSTIDEGSSLYHRGSKGSNQMSIATTIEGMKRSHRQQRRMTVDVSLDHFEEPPPLEEEDGPSLSLGPILDEASSTLVQTSISPSYNNNSVGLSEASSMEKSSKEESPDRGFDLVLHPMVRQPSALTVCPFDLEDDDDKAEDQLVESIPVTTNKTNETISAQPPKSVGTLTATTSQMAKSKNKNRKLDKKKKKVKRKSSGTSGKTKGCCIASNESSSKPRRQKVKRLSTASASDAESANQKPSVHPKRHSYSSPPPWKDDSSSRLPRKGRGKQISFSRKKGRSKSPVSQPPAERSTSLPPSPVQRLKGKVGRRSMSPPPPSPVRRSKDKAGRRSISPPPPPSHIRRSKQKAGRRSMSPPPPPSSPSTASRRKWSSQAQRTRSRSPKSCRGRRHSTASLLSPTTPASPSSSSKSKRTSNSKIIKEDQPKRKANVNRFSSLLQVDSSRPLRNKTRHTFPKTTTTRNHRLLSLSDHLPRSINKKSDNHRRRRKSNDTSKATHRRRQADSFEIDYRNDQFSANQSSQQQEIFQARKSDTHRHRESHDTSKAIRRHGRADSSESDYQNDQSLANLSQRDKKSKGGTKRSSKNEKTKGTKGFAAIGKPPSCPNMSSPRETRGWRKVVPSSARF